MSNKSKIERNILDLVYKDQSKLTVIHKDKPDFIIKNENGDEFGVEVTELYNNDSDARLKNIPNYTKELIDTKKYRHKHDKKILRVEKISINKLDGEIVETTAIIQESAKLSEYLKQISEKIDAKTHSKKEYTTNLLHINLIIKDNSDVFLQTDAKDFFDLFFTDELIKSVMQTDFKEIFLITRFKEGQLVQRLKIVLLGSRIFLFHEIFKYYEIGDITDDLYYQYLSEFLIYEGFKNIRLKRLNNEIELIYCNIGFLVKDFEDLIFRDYSDYNYQIGEEITFSENVFINEEVKQIISKVKETFGFSSNIGQTK